MNSLGEGFKGDKTFLLIILQAKWVYQLVYLYNILYGHPFHPSVPSSIHPSSSSWKKKMMEEDDDDDEWQQQQFIQTF
jgi:hypothetical protein